METNIPEMPFFFSRYKFYLSVIHLMHTRHLQCRGLPPGQSRYRYSMFLFVLPKYPFSEYTRFFV